MVTSEAQVPHFLDQALHYLHKGLLCSPPAGSLPESVLFPLFNALKATPPLLGWVSVETRLQAAYVRNGAGHEVITAPLHLGRRNLAPEGHMRLAFMCCAFQRKCSNCQPRYLAVLRVETLVWRVAKITRMGSDPAWEGVREVLVSLLDFSTSAIAEWEGVTAAFWWSVIIVGKFLRWNSTMQSFQHQSPSGSNCKDKIWVLPQIQI